jgi:hypothetical protein
MRLTDKQPVSWPMLLAHLILMKTPGWLCLPAIKVSFVPVRI